MPAPKTAAPSESIASDPETPATPAAAVDAPEATGTEHPVSGWRRHAKAAIVFCLLVIALSVGAGAVHIVAPGETLSEIAAAHGTTARTLAAANNLRNPNLILVGQQLVIPEGGTVHVVAAGDTVGEIAARYRTTVSAIVEANSLRNPNLIKIGQNLTIPQPGTNSEVAPLYHVVQRGESLASIAAKYGMSVEVLAAANGMRPDSVIFEGTGLRLTPAPTYEEPVNSTTVHVVARGETLAEIAALYSTTVNRLVELNDITNPNLIRSGQRLTVAGGGFQCPVPGARFFNDWGFPRSGGRYHQGNDLFAPGGTPVLAPVSGRVEQVDGTVGGIQFWLYGDDGNLYIGTHMSAHGASGRVSAGDVVGRVGDSGNARGSRPHLHFEVMIDGEQNINPYPLLVKACR